MHPNSQEVYRAIWRNIDEFGQHLMGVFPRLGHPEDGVAFIYTIGMALDGYPEFLMFGPHQHGEILNMLCARVRAQNRSFRNGEKYSLGGEHPVKIVNACDWVKDDYTSQVARALDVSIFRVQQVLIPDRQGLHADEPGCDPRYASYPVLTREKQ